VPCLLLYGIFLFSSVGYARASDCRSPKYDETTTLISVVDGDTVILQDGRKLRLIGINTPEMQRQQEVAEPFAHKARVYLSKLIPAGTTIHLRYGVDKKDRYGRLLAHVFTSKDQNVAELLLKAGMGSSVQITPNLWSYHCYLEAEKQAQTSKTGIWSHPYSQFIDVKNISPDAHGFHFVQGQITRVGKSKNAVWLNMGKQFALRISNADLIYFKQMDLEKLRGKTVAVRGWIYKIKKQQRINLHHPATLQMLSAISDKAHNR